VCLDFGFGFNSRSTGGGVRKGLAARAGPESYRWRHVRFDPPERYAALTPIKIQDDRYDTEDMLAFRYWILEDGGEDFSVIKES
jgi:hypothetical protein